MRELQVSLTCDSDPSWPVGTVVERGGEIWFAFEASFLERGLELSPYDWPLHPGLKVYRPKAGCHCLASWTMPALMGGDSSSCTGPSQPRGALRARYPRSTSLLGWASAPWEV